MTLCDSNVWLALALSGHIHHRAASAYLETIEEANSVCFCRFTQQTFLRLLTNAAVLAPYGNPALTNKQAWSAYLALAGDDRVGFLATEPPGLEGTWARFAVRKTASPKLWMDAYLAAFAVAAGVSLASTDAAFEQFSGLDLVLISSKSDRGV